MTGLLKDLMNDRAEHAGAPQLDLDAIVAAGDRQVRRRRIATGTGLVAAVAVVAGAIAIAPNIIDTSTPDPVRRPTAPDFSVAQPTYAVDSTIHYGDQIIDVSPLTVESFARADHGFIFVNNDNHVYLADGVDQPMDLGPSGGSIMAGGPYAAYVSASEEDPAVIVYNTVDDTEALRVRLDAPTDAQAWTALYAIDGSQLYWHDRTGVVVSDISAPTEDPIVLKPGASSGWLFDASLGVLARESFDDVTVTVSRDTEATAPNFAGANATLSPTATHVATVEAGRLRVFDVASGKDVSPRTDMPVMQFVNWLDDGRYVIAAAATHDRDFNLLACSTSTRACDVLAPTVGRFDALRTPEGG